MVIKNIHNVVLKVSHDLVLTEQAFGGNRTLDLVLTKDALYRLSHKGTHDTPRPTGSIVKRPLERTWLSRPSLRQAYQ
jgi:hypothetical protein